MTASIHATKKGRLVLLLKDRRYHSARELLRVGGFRYGGRLHELRADGYRFTIKRDEKHQSLFWYRMTAKPGL
jgi:hypothetical protein